MQKKLGCLHGFTDKVMVGQIFIQDKWLWIIVLK